MRTLRRVTETSCGSVSRSATSDAICQLKYRYLRTLDTKQWDEFEDCFVPEATGDYNGLVFDDRAALVAYMRENLGEGLLTMHQAHHPEIEVDGDTATGTLVPPGQGDRRGVQVHARGRARSTATATCVRRTAGGSPTPATGAPSRRRTTSSDLPGFKVNGPGVHTPQ